MDHLDSVVLDLLSRKLFKPECLAGPEAIPAKAALKDLPCSVSEVLSLARRWRTRQDSNL